MTARRWDYPAHKRSFHREADCGKQYPGEQKLPIRVRRGPSSGSYSLREVSFMQVIYVYILVVLIYVCFWSLYYRRTGYG